MTQPLRIVSSASELIDSDAAVHECLDGVRRQLGGAPAHLVFLFVSPHHRDAYALIQETLLEELKPVHLVGCTGGGVIGGGRELEDSPGLSVCAASLDGVDVEVRHLRDDDLPGPDEPPRAWESMAGVRQAQQPQFIALLSPFMTRSDELLAGMDYAFPGCLKVGGVVSGLRHVSERSLFLDGQRFNDGALLVALSGDIRVDSLVAQGCRPVGPVCTVTGADRNVIEALDGRPSVYTLQKIYEGADARTRDLLQRALLVGLVTDPLAVAEPQPGDWLIRNVMGLDDKSGSVAVGAFVREGMRVQFHVRDGEAADQDLRKVIERFLGRADAPKVAGGLLFSCVGRGERLFGEPDHDSQAFAQAFGTPALGGFFCNGEIGPVGGGTYLHGFTSCFALFSRPAAKAE